ncbi:hypothetical protein CEXT_158641 [Caerostris extrusa]|uniref:Uncharacterized protein n=1 Tax=Caerostris extrusa TaxID=172846 RepID=A0AAV4UKI9_CAEEX|nr:hypothetical protein CEXT_158641 [Caerostris extrusa]
MLVMNDSLQRRAILPEGHKKRYLAERGVSNNCRSRRGRGSRWTALKIGFVELRYLGVDVGNSLERVMGKERAFPEFSVSGWPDGYHQEGFKGAAQRCRGGCCAPISEQGCTLVL